MSVRITMTSDFICPWCYIGEARLNEALADLPDGVEVDLEWAPYELNPDMQPEGMDRKVYRSLKFSSWARSQQLDAGTIAAAKDDGVVFNYEKMERTPNTFQAHRLSHLAKQEGVQSKAFNAILGAYFTEGRDIGDRETLIQIGIEIGLDADRVRTFMEGDEGEDEVRAAIQAQMGGVRGVPQFDIEGTVLSGAQPAELIRDAILKASTSDASARTAAE